MKKIIIVLLFIPALSFGQLSTLKIQKWLVVGDTIKADSIKVGNLWLSENTMTSDTLSLSNRIDAKQDKMPFDSIQMNTVTPTNLGAGTAYYDGVSWSIKSGYDNVIGQVNREMWGAFPVKNTSAAIIANGRLVRVTGSQGSHLTVALAGNSTSDSANVYAMATMDIPINGFGIVTTIGAVNDIPTNTLTDGIDAYLGQAGRVTNTKPTSGYVVKVGKCVYSHAINGSFEVHIDKANDIRTTTETNFANGTILKSNGTNIAAAVAGTDYVAGGTGSANQLAVFSNTGTISGSSSLQYLSSGLNAASITNNTSARLGEWSFQSDANIIFSAPNLFFDGANYKSLKNQPGVGFFLSPSAGDFSIRSYPATAINSNVTLTQRLGINASNGRIFLFSPIVASFPIELNGTSRITSTNQLIFGGTGASDYNFSLNHNGTNFDLKPRVDGIDAVRFGNAAGTVFPIIVNTSNGYAYSRSTSSSDSIFTNRKWTSDKIISLTQGDVTVVDTSYNAATNLFPSVGSGGGGAVKKGDWYKVGYNKGGTLGGIAVVWKSTLVALVDAPGQTLSNWDVRIESVVPIGRTATENYAGYIKYTGFTETAGSWFGGNNATNNNTTRLSYNGALYAGRLESRGAIKSYAGSTQSYLSTTEVYSDGSGTFKTGVVSTGVPLDSNKISFKHGVTLGEQAGKFTSGSNTNTLVGYFSGRYAKGTNNTYIGYQTANFMRGGNGNIIIGANNFANKFNAVNNQLIIDNSASDTVSNFIAGDMNADTLRANLQLRVGKGNNYSQIETDGSISFNGNATYWDDIDFPIVVRTAGVNIPSIATTQGNLTSPQWSVNDYAVCEKSEIPHGAKLGATTYQWHIHIETGGTNVDNRYIAFEIEWTWANKDGQFVTPATLSSGDLLIPANTPANTHLVFNIGSAFGLTGQTLGAHVKPRLKRVASVGTAPTANPFCEMIQIHYESDQIGSRTITGK